LADEGKKTPVLNGEAAANHDSGADEENTRQTPQKPSAEENKAQEYLALLQRTQADFQNYMRNAEKERQRLREVSSDDMILAIIEINENIEAAQKTIKATNENKRTVDGINAVLRQIQKILLEKGVQRIPSVGSAFDASLHESLEGVESKEKPENTIIEEVQSGYTVNGRLLRPAKVIVTKKQEVDANA